MHISGPWRMPGVLECHDGMPGVFRWRFGMAFSRSGVAFQNALPACLMAFWCGILAFWRSVLAF